MLRRFEKKCKFLFLIFLRRLSIFLRDGLYEMRERSSKKSGRAAGQNFYGEEKLGGRDLWVGETSDYLLGGRYKVCKRERGFIFIFTFTFIYFCFFFSKGFNQILMYCPQNKKEEKEKEKEPAVAVG